MTASADKLSKLLDERTRNDFPAISVAIGRTDRLIWQYAAGYADLSNRLRNSADTAFGIGSITKVFVAVILLQLSEEGQMTLDDSLSDWLEPAQLAGIANAQVATIRQLLSHYAGIPSWEDQPGWIHVARGKDSVADKIWRPDEALEYIYGKPALALPDEKFYYSNSSFTLLGMLIERVTGSTLEDALNQQIFRPLSLKQTRLWGYPLSDRHNIATRYHRADAHFIQHAGIAGCFTPEREAMINVSAASLSVEWAAGGMVSTAGELMRFCLALKSGALVTPQSLCEMQRWRPAGEAQIGLSLFRTDSAYGPAIGHGGNVLGYSACAWWFRETDCALVILTNLGSMHAAAEADCASRLFSKPAIVRLAHEICEGG